MDTFIEKESLRYHMPYYTNTITGESQWGINTFEHSQLPLPENWVRLINSDGKSFYKCISEEEYIKTELLPTNEYILHTYEELEMNTAEKARKEIKRRDNLLVYLAQLLHVEKETIGDESLDYLSELSRENPEMILFYIEAKEKEEIGEDAKYTFLQTIKKKHTNTFSKDISIRHLFGLDKRRVHISNAVQLSDNLICDMSHHLMVDPVTISSGHTYERTHIKKWFETKLTCPKSREHVRNELIEDTRIKALTKDFVKMYIYQKGDEWKPIRELCLAYIQEKKEYDKERKRKNLERFNRTIRPKTTFSNRLWQPVRSISNQYEPTASDFLA